MVTLAVSAVVVVVLAGGYLTHKRGYESEADLRDMEMKAQMAMNTVKGLIRTAGLGCEDNFKSGAGFFQGATRSFANVITSLNRNDGPDSLTVVTGLRARTRVNCAAGTCTNNVIQVLDAGGFDTGPGRYLFPVPSIRNRFVQVLDVSGTALTLDTALTVHHDDLVYRVNAYTMGLDMDGDGSRLDVDGDGSGADGDGDNVPDLYVHDNLADLADESLSKVADGVEDIQFQYIWDMDGNGLIEGTEWTWKDDPAGNLDRIRAVRVWLLIRSLKPDPHFEDTHEADGQPKTYIVADHRIDLDTQDANGIDSHFDHRFHRRLYVETVQVRNRNL